MIMAADKQDKVLNFSIEREQSGACSSSAECEKNQGKNFLNVPNLRFPEFKDDWNDYHLRDLCTFHSGGTPSIDNAEYWEGEIPFVSAVAMHNTHIEKTPLTLTEKGLRDGSKQLEAGNLLLLVRGSMLWNKIPICYNDVDVAFNQDVKGIVPNSKTTSLFLLNWIQSHENRIKYMVTGTGIGAGKLDSEDLLALNVKLPSLIEQKKIEKFLSLIDERIETQIRIIEELKLFRDTLMFKLLSPRKNWEHVCIHDVAMVVGGGTPDTNVKEYWDGNIQWFTPSEIGKEKYAIASERTISQAGLDNSSAKLLPANTILLSTRATIGECSIAKQECCTNQGFQSLIATTVTPEFLYYLIQTKKRDLLSKASGSTFSEISANEVRKIRVCIPTTAKEQEAIVQPLSAYDEKIETECKILQLYKRQKQFLLSQMFI